MPQDILLVDDNIFNQDGIRLYLSRKGFNLQEAGDEATAWKLAQSQHFTAAVVDISIPPDSKTPVRSKHSFGIHLARRLKESQPAMGVVLFSAYEGRGAEAQVRVTESLSGVSEQFSDLGLSLEETEQQANQMQAHAEAINDLLEGGVLESPTFNEMDSVAQELDRFDDSQAIESQLATLRQELQESNP